MGGLRLLEHEALSPEGVAQLERVRAAAELTAGLSEEVLRGGAPRTPAPDALCDLHRLVGDEMRRSRGAAAPHGVTVRLEMSEAAPRMVRADPMSMRRILANAMANALRHARAEVALSVATSADGALRIAVADDGPGFEAEVPERLFAPAGKGAASTGSGLGLHIAASHAEWIGARLSARNRPEGGALVELILPPEAAAPAAVGDLPDLAGWRVLVADDSETVQALLSGMLGRLGATCERALDGVAALNWLSRERFDLALVDAEMPLLTGAEVIRAERVRQVRGVAPPMPMVALTAHVDGAGRAALSEAGADGVLLKPLPDVETFGRALAALVDTAAPRQDWRPESAPPLSAATLVELMRAAGPAHQDEVLARLSDDLAGVDAALRTAAETLDRPALRFQAHVLLSLAGAVGALPTRAAALRLNAVARDGTDEMVRIDARLCAARLAELRAELARAGAAPQNP